jgi:hypothetical protein
MPPNKNGKAVLKKMLASHFMKSLLVIICPLLLPCLAPAASALETGFAHPPEEIRP